MENDSLYLLYTYSDSTLIVYNISILVTRLIFQSTQRDLDSKIDQNSNKEFLWDRISEYLTQSITQKFMTESISLLMT